MLLLLSCNSVKRNQKFVSSGNYDQAIDLAVKKLQKDKYSEKNSEHVILLEEAFAKAVERDHRRISVLKKESRLESLRELFHLYRNLENRQDHIRPLLPLTYGNGKNARFRLQDYTDELLEAKQKLGDKLYLRASDYLQRDTKKDARMAYGLLEELKELRPHDASVASMLNDALIIGTDYVYVSLSNRSGQIIPRRLEQELLDFNTYGLDEFWTEYHAERNNSLDYDYGIALVFRQIDFSPERISETEERRTKRIQDGWEYRKDREGNIIKDEDGNPVKFDVFTTVSAVIRITIQNKAALVGGDVIYRDLKGQRDIDKFALGTEFVFENAFATFTGDERALSNEDRVMIKNRFRQFPSNAQMLLDAGDELKNRLREILKNNPI